MELETNGSSYIRSNYKNAHLMGEDEKVISFMNRYFVFIKMREVDAANIYKNITHKTAEEIDIKSSPTRVIVKQRRAKIVINK